MPLPQGPSLPAHLNPNPQLPFWVAPVNRQQSLNIAPATIVGDSVLTVDASTPAVASVPAAVFSASTNAFSPPAGSIIMLCIGAGGSTPGQLQDVTFIEDNLGLNLNWISAMNNDSADVIGIYGACVELWWAYLPQAATGLVLTAHFGDVTYGATPNGGIVPIVFTGANIFNQIGQTNFNQATGAPTCSITGTRAGSRSLAVTLINSGTAPTVPSGQTTTINGNSTQVINSGAGIGFWVQTTTALGTGGSQTINDTAPSASFITIILEVQALVGCNIVAASTVTGALSTTTPASLSGSIVATSAVSGIIKTTAPITGSVSASSSISGTIKTTAPITGSVAVTSSFSGNLAAPALLTGAVVATSTLVGVVNTTGSITGSIIAASAVTGAITTTAPLTGAIIGTSTVTGVVKTTAPIAGSIIASSTVSGSLQTTIVGTVIATSTFSGTIKTTAPITGSVSSTSSLVGILHTTALMTGNVAGSSSFAGTVTTTARITGSVVSSFSFSGSVVTNIPPILLWRGCKSTDNQIYTVGPVAANERDSSFVIIVINPITGQSEKMLVTSGQWASIWTVTRGFLSTTPLDFPPASIVFLAVAYIPETWAVATWVGDSTIPNHPNEFDFTGILDVKLVPNTPTVLLKSQAELAIAHGAKLISPTAL